MLDAPRTAAKKGPILLLTAVEAPREPPFGRESSMKNVPGEFEAPGAAP